MEKAWDAFKAARDIRDAAQQALDKAFATWSDMDDEWRGDDDDDDKIRARISGLGLKRE